MTARTFDPAAGDVSWPHLAQFGPPERAGDSPARLRRSPSKFDPVHLRLGSRRFDVTHRALVVGVLELGWGLAGSIPEAADVLVSEGADLVCLRSAPGRVTPPAELLATVADLAGRVAVPIGVEAGASGGVDAIRAGASLVHCAGEPPEELAETAAEHGAALVVAGCAGEIAQSSPIAQLQTYGLAGESIVLEAPTLNAVRRLAPLGQPVQFSVLEVPTTAQQRETGLAEVAAAITAGCRLICTRDVAGARRTAAVLAAVLKAR